MVGKTAICSLNTSSVWTDLEFGNSIRNGVTPDVTMLHFFGVDKCDPKRVFYYF